MAPLHIAVVPDTVTVGNGFSVKVIAVLVVLVHPDTISSACA